MIDETKIDETLDNFTLKARLKDRGFNITRLCERYGIQYKTFMGWLSGRQKTLSAETTAYVMHMIIEERLDDEGENK